MKPSLCLNMIVRNEGARIERCLRSALPYVKSAVVLDTGSTDDTKEIITRLCREYDVVPIVREGVFTNFSQARNDAWKLARTCNGLHVDNGRDVVPWCQYALLMDADMELVVDDPEAFDCLFDGTALSLDMMQTGGSITYGNRRIVNLQVPRDDIYVGATHEYIDIPANGMITGARFIDHADGSNRADKYPRDVRLLEDDLKRDPNNARSWFYLANTYRDWGKHALAGVAYKKRIELGGWDEEVHNAMMNLANCRRACGDEAGFVSGMVDAYRFRPSRAEPLYDLARHYRDKGAPAAAMLYAKPGMEIPRPSDLLFVNDFVYSHGLRYEFSVSGYYSDADRPRAFEITDSLALDPACDPAHRWSARSNLFWYTKPLKDHCPSFAAYQLGFTPPSDYVPMNPSVECFDGKLTCNVRCVNYRIDEHGRYVILDGGEPIRTRNFLVELDPETFAERTSHEVIWDRPAPAWDMVIGLEDIRLWRHEKELRFSATVRERSAQGVCQIATGWIDATGRADVWRIVSDEVTYEKNWMPMPAEDGGTPRFVYRLDTIIEPDRNLTTKHHTDAYINDISGSSQLIPFNEGFLAVTHEASNDPSTGKRTYWHRFVWFDNTGRLRRLSQPFVFFARQIEFCAGLAQLPNGKLLVSFGVRDAEAWVATIDAHEVSHMLWKFHES